MIRFNFNLRNLALALGLGTAVLGLNCVAQAQPWLQQQAQNIGGAVRNPGGTARRETQRATTTAHSATRNAGQVLGNSVPVKPIQPNFRSPTQPGNSRLNTTFKPTMMRDRVQPVMNQGGQTLNSTASTANRTLNGPAFQRTLVNPMPVGTNPQQLRSDIRHTRQAVGIGMSAIGTNINGGTSAAGQQFQQSRRDVTQATQQFRNTVVGPQTQITTKPFFRLPKPPVIVPPTVDPGIGIDPTGPQARPLYPQPNHTAETLNGVANLVGAIVGAAQNSGGLQSADAGYVEYSQGGGVPAAGWQPEPAYQTQQTYSNPDPVEAPLHPLDQFSENLQDRDPSNRFSEPAVAGSLLIYNAGNVDQAFGVEVVAGQPQLGKLQVGEAVEVNAEKVVLSYATGQQVRRYTLSAGEAYKFTPGKDGVVNLVSFDPSTLASE